MRNIKVSGDGLAENSAWKGAELVLTPVFYSARGSRVEVSTRTWVRPGRAEKSTTSTFLNFPVYDICDWTSSPKLDTTFIPGSTHPEIPKHH